MASMVATNRRLRFRTAALSESINQSGPVRGGVLGATVSSGGGGFKGTVGTQGGQ